MIMSISDKKEKIKHKREEREEDHKREDRG